MAETQIKVYGTSWCGDCHRSKRFLDKNEIKYDWIDIDQDDAGLAYVRSVNDGNRTVPTILFADGDILVEPADAELGAKLGL